MVYVITNYTLKKAKDEDVIVKVSTNKLKKIDVFDKNGDKLASVGAIRKNGIPYMDYPNYIKNIGLVKANKKRSAYLARHAHEKKTKIIKGRHRRTPSYYADKLLW
jgi:hypothetical protein